MIEWIGWLSSFILCLTIAKQVHKQWSAGTSEGVSKWLYIGQVASNVGFIIYSAILKNWVFLATSAVLLMSNLLGLLIVFYHRRRQSRISQDPSLTDLRMSSNRKQA